MNFIEKNMKWVIRILIGLVVVFVLFTWFQTCRANRLEDKAILEEGKAIQAKNDFVESKKKSDKAISDLNSEIESEKKGREQANVEIAKIKKESKKKDLELVNAKKLIRTLSPDELCFSLNERVPTEFSLLEAGDFHLSRLGGELTLEIFMDKERFEDKLTEKDEEISKLKGNGVKFQSEIKSWTGKYDLKVSDLGKCEKALKSSESALDSLKKSVRSMKWKERGKGAVGGALFVVIVLKLLGGK